jgi:N-acetyl-anhydromuramyl-L-alanine amidase AmpD
MARYPKAQWLPANPANYSTDKITHKFIVIHVESGTESGTNAWFQNPKAQVSAHFGVAKTGQVFQFVDTDETAWAEAELNGESISIEHEGLSGQNLTPQQIAADKELLEWIYATYKIPLVMTFNQNDPKGGVIPHGKINEGALSHPDCPGQPIINDVENILKTINTPTPPVK